MPHKSLCCCSMTRKYMSSDWFWRHTAPTCPKGTRHLPGRQSAMLRAYEQEGGAQVTPSPVLTSKRLLENGAWAASPTLLWVCVCRAVQGFIDLWEPVGFQTHTTWTEVESRPGAPVCRGVLHLGPLRALSHLLLYKALNSPRFVTGCTNTCLSSLRSEFSSWESDFQFVAMLCGWLTLGMKRKDLWLPTLWKTPQYSEDRVPEGSKYLAPWGRT